MFKLFKTYKQKRKEKRIQEELDLIQQKYNDYWIFQVFFPLGDFAIVCSLIKQFKNEHGGKVLVLVRDEQRAKLAKLFPSIDEVIILSRKTYQYILRHPNLTLEKGKYYEMSHWKFYDAPRYKSKNFLELYANMLGVKNLNNLESPVFTDEMTAKCTNIFSSMDLDKEKTVLITPHANSFNSSLITEDFWISLVKKLENLGYQPILNTNSKKIFKDKTIKKMFLPIDEQLCFSSMCKKIISLRAGINDIFAIMGLENLIILYPKSFYFNTISKIKQLIEFKRAFYDDESISFEDNMYRITSLKMFDLIGLNEILCDSKETVYTSILESFEKID